jgi:hypothetical protein
VGWCFGFSGTKQLWLRPLCFWKKKRLTRSKSHLYSSLLSNVVLTGDTIRHRLCSVTTTLITRPNPVPNSTLLVPSQGPADSIHSRIITMQACFHACCNTGGLEPVLHSTEYQAEVCIALHHITEASRANGFEEVWAGREEHGTYT